MFTIAWGYSYNETLSIPTEDIADFFNDIYVIYNIKLEKMGIKTIQIRR